MPNDLERPAEASEAKDPAKPRDDIGVLIDKWFAEHIHNSVASRDTEILNHLNVAKEELKRLIVAR